MPRTLIMMVLKFAAFLVTACILALFLMGVASEDLLQSAIALTLSILSLNEGITEFIFWRVTRETRREVGE